MSNFKNKKMRFTGYFLLFIFVFGFKSMLSARNHTDDIVGYYLTTDPFSGVISQICIYNAGNNVYEAMLIWCDDEVGNKQAGLVFLKNMVFNEKANEWQNAIITYPGKSGKFKAFMRLEKDGRLRIRSYWGISLLGMTLYWPREEKSRNPQIQHP
jgi:uncharacterized protein (DUF2147 family)